jgi:uridylate kinase
LVRILKSAGSFVLRSVSEAPSDSFQFKSFILKITGEVFRSKSVLKKVCQEIAELPMKKALVVGGGNLIRGRERGLERRLLSDRIGLLSTIINGLILEETLRQYGETLHLSSLPIPGIVEGYSKEKAERAFNSRLTLILSGGTGNPFFSTDTACALRALELSVDLVMKGTRVDGIYSKDPERFPDAKFYKELTYEKALRERLEIMDQTALLLLSEVRKPLVVFNIFKPGNIRKILKKSKVGSWVC